MSELPPASSGLASLLEEATRCLSLTQLELEAKGYPPGIARAAVMRARGIAEYKTRDISPSIREQAFLDILVAELRKAETWTVQEMSQSDGSGSDNLE